MFLKKNKTTDTQSLTVTYCAYVQNVPFVRITFQHSVNNAPDFNLQHSNINSQFPLPYDYRLLYSWLYNTEIYFGKCPDDFHIADRRVKYGKVIWARV